MQFDSDALHKLLAHSDEELWMVIRQIAKANGISIAEAPPPKAEMAKLRELLSGAGGTDYQSALSMLAAYRKRG